MSSCPCFCSLRFRSQLLFHGSRGCLETHHLEEAPSSDPCTVIDGHPISSRDILEESELVHVVLGDLACVIGFNIIHSPDHSVILGLPWFELYNPNIDRINWFIKEAPKNLKSKFLNVSKATVVRTICWHIDECEGVYSDCNKMLSICADLGRFTSSPKLLSLSSFCFKMASSILLLFLFFMITLMSLIFSRSSL